MNCTICGEPIVLVPSAQQRAERFGGLPSHYTKLFTAHGACQVKKREEDTLRLLKKQRSMTTKR